MYDEITKKRFVWKTDQGIILEQLKANERRISWYLDVILKKLKKNVQRL